VECESEKYARAGILMLPVVDPEGSRTFRQILVTAAALVALSLLPAIAGLTGVFYFFGALGLSVALLQVCVWGRSAKTNNELNGLCTLPSRTSRYACFHGVRQILR